MSDHESQSSVYGVLNNTHFWRQFCSLEDIVNYSYFTFKVLLWYIFLLRLLLLLLLPIDKQNLLPVVVGHIYIISWHKIEMKYLHWSLHRFFTEVILTRIRIDSTTHF